MNRQRWLALVAAALMGLTAAFVVWLANAPQLPSPDYSRSCGSFAQGRPAFPNAISLNSIHPGVTVEVHNTEIDPAAGLDDPEPTHRDIRTITSEPFKQKADMRIKIVTDQGVHREVSLSDMGVIPYGGDCWSPSIYTTFFYGT